MRLNARETQQRDRLAELEDRAGGLLAAPDAGVWTQGGLDALPTASRNDIDAILDLVGAPKTVPAQLSLADKRAFLKVRLTESAEVVMIAARNFEAMPDETVNTLYDALAELEHRSGRRT
jgi:hypothetical protein